MTSQNVKHLTIGQLQRLIEQYGVADNGNEYDMTSLKESLIDKQSKATDTWLKSNEAKQKEIDSMSSYPTSWDDNLEIKKVKLNEIKCYKVKFNFKNTLFNELSYEQKCYWFKQMTQ